MSLMTVPGIHKMTDFRNTFIEHFYGAYYTEQGTGNTGNNSTKMLALRTPKICILEKLSQDKTVLCVMVNTCNPSTVGGWGRRNANSNPAWATY